MPRLLFLAFTLAACVQSKPDAKSPQQAQGSGSNVVCHEVTDTGSLFSHTECTPVDESNAERDDADRFVKTHEGGGAARH